jgi:SpoVK/Ycf46/Vps4 family AAA+-type ATPase
MSSEVLERREQIEALVEDSLGAVMPLCQKAHSVFQLLASSHQLIVVRGSEERRIIDNFSVIGHALGRVVYHWSLTSGLFRCLPSASNIQQQAIEDIVLSDEARKKLAGGPGLPALLYYLREEWQHPYRGSAPQQNPTFDLNRTNVTEDEMRGSVFILKDAHMLLQGQNNTLALRMLKDLIEATSWQVGSSRVSVSGRADNSLDRMTIVITAPIGWEIPSEIRDVTADLTFPRPTSEEFSSLLYSAANIDPSSNDEKYTIVSEQEGKVLHAATGLSAHGFIQSIRVSCVEQKLDRNSPLHFRHDIIATAKKSAIKAGGAVIYEEPNCSMEDVGGHDVLKQYLSERAIFFDPDNPIHDRLPKGVVLPTPKGILMVGIPGCGKSLEAKAMASMLGVPLLTLDMGAVFTGLVGGSESRVREALQLAEECAPCVMRIEEIEKALSGSGSSNFSDGGTTNRVFQTVLNWLQEHDKPVFVVATANDISQLPPELLRKGRFDEIFFVDIPVANERIEIFRIHLRKWAGLTDKQIDANFDLEKLALDTPNFSGAEIEALIKASLYSAVSQHDKDGTLDKFDFTPQHIHDTIYRDNVRTFKILFDSEAERLGELRKIATANWLSASSYKTSKADIVMPKKSNSISDDFFSEDVVEGKEPITPVVPAKKRAKPKSPRLSDSI